MKYTSNNTVKLEDYLTLKKNNSALQGRVEYFEKLFSTTQEMEQNNKVLSKDLAQVKMVLSCIPREEVCKACAREYASCPKIHECHTTMYSFFVMRVK